MRVDITGLAKRLSQTASGALERAAAHAKDKGHAEVTIDHVLFQILAVKGEDAELLATAGGLEREDVLAATRKRVAGIPGDHDTRPGFAKTLWPWVEHAWLISSAELEQSRVRTGALLWAAARDSKALDRNTGEALAALKGPAVREALAKSPETAELFSFEDLEKLGAAAEDKSAAKAREKISKEREVAAKAAAKEQAAKAAEEEEAAKASAAARAAWDAAEAHAEAEAAIVRASEAADAAKAAAAAIASGAPRQSDDD